MNTSETKITVACPSGHRVRGAAELAGHHVKCPKCQVEFMFSPPKPAANRAVTDTGVMRILGDLPPAAAASNERVDALCRPCPKCGVSISESLAVCNHCNCYVGVMPSFLQQLGDDRRRIV